MVLRRERPLPGGWVGGAVGAVNSEGRGCGGAECETGEGQGGARGEVQNEMYYICALELFLNSTR